MILQDPHESIAALEETLAAFRKALEKLRRENGELRDELWDYRRAHDFGISVSEVRRLDQRFREALERRLKEANEASGGRPD